MKLKNLATSLEDRLKKFDEYIDNINFENFKYFKKDIYYSSDDKNLYINSDGEMDDNELKEFIKKIVKKYWKQFESGVDYHKYDNNYFIEIKSDEKHANMWYFIVESSDDSLYFKFNTNFVLNL